MASETPANSGSNAAAFVPPAEPPPLYDSRPLPAGWVKEFDSRSNRNYYVDTLAQPPRSIWVHPLDDPDFVSTHAHDGDTDDDHSNASHSRPSSALSNEKKDSSYPEDKKPRESEDGHLAVPSTSSSRPGHSRNQSDSSATSPTKKKRGFFGKLKDEIIGTKEEREAAAARRELRRKEEEKHYYQQRDAMMARRLQLQEQERVMWEQRQQQYYQQQQQYGRYGPPSMNSYGGPTYQGPYNYGSSPYGGNQYYGRQQRGGGSSAAPLVGGLIGGLLLGDLLF